MHNKKGLVWNPRACVRDDRVSIRVGGKANQLLSAKNDQGWCSRMKFLGNFGEEALRPGRSEELQLDEKGVVTAHSPNVGCGRRLLERQQRKPLVGGAVVDRLGTATARDGR